MSHQSSGLSFRAFGGCVYGCCTRIASIDPRPASTPRIRLHLDKPARRICNSVAIAMMMNDRIVKPHPTWLVVWLAVPFARGWGQQCGGRCTADNCSVGVGRRSGSPKRRTAQTHDETADLSRIDVVSRHKSVSRKTNNKCPAYVCVHGLESWKGSENNTNCLTK